MFRFAMNVPPTEGEMKTKKLEIRRESLASPLAQELIAELNAELSAMYPEAGATHFRLDPEETAEGRGAFLVAYNNGIPIACGAIRRIDPTTVEIKRMYVRQSARGTGAGRAILEALFAQARDLNVERVVLETGVRQIAAIGLYESYGFTHIPLYGEYLGSPLSICMEKRL
ncbi:MAG: GNAT family N-acetyltransferase [Candidatus Zixiibacteriota bacterium]